MINLMIIIIERTLKKNVIEALSELIMKGRK